MNRDIGWIFAPLLAVVVLGFVVFQTLGALHAAGAWMQPAHMTQAAPDDPFVMLAKRLDADARTSFEAPNRDPFAFGGGAVASNSETPAKPVVKKPVVPPPPPRPVLTAIVWAADPSALVHWKDRDWTVHTGALFDEFQVVSITRDQVVLKRGDETLILKPKPQGE